MIVAFFFDRGGFQQITELIAESEALHVFAVPSFLTGNMLTFEETQAILIVEKPVFPSDPTGSDLELLEVFVRACSTRREWIKSEDEKVELNEAVDDLERQITGADYLHERIASTNRAPAGSNCCSSRKSD
jgi:hypothetical protein